MTQAAVRAAMDRHFSCPQLIPEIMNTSNKNQNRSTSGAANRKDKSSQGTSGKGKGPATEKSLTLWSYSLNCDTCKMLIDSAMQPRKLKHACRLVLWRCFGHRFANSYVKLPLPPALIDYVGDLTNS